MVSDPKENVNACDEFLTLAVTSHFLMATVKMLVMLTLDDVPTTVTSIPTDGRCLVMIVGQESTPFVKKLLPSTVNFSRSCQASGMM